MTFVWSVLNSAIWILACVMILNCVRLLWLSKTPSVARKSIRSARRRYAAGGTGGCGCECRSSCSSSSPPTSRATALDRSGSRWILGRRGALNSISIWRGRSRKRARSAKPSVQLTLPMPATVQQMLCPQCSGLGCTKTGQPCRRCRRTGVIQAQEQPCSRCRGVGETARIDAWGVTSEEKCRSCRGKGVTLVAADNWED